MRSVRDPTARRALIARVERLSAASQRRWGRMRVAEMLAHVADQLRIALGDVAVQEVRGRLRFQPMRYLAMHVLPWPKGKARAPEESFTTAPTSFEADRATLVALITRFAETPEQDLAPLHPLFGPVTGRDWDVLSHRHLDHHLKRFGV